MDIWHWIFSAALGGLAGWSWAGIRLAGEAKARGHQLRGLVAAVMICLFAYTAFGISLTFGGLTLVLSALTGLVGYLVGRRSFSTVAKDE